MVFSLEGAQAAGTAIVCAAAMCAAVAAQRAVGFFGASASEMVFSLEGAQAAGAASAVQCEAPCEAPRAMVGFFGADAAHREGAQAAGTASAAQRRVGFFGADPSKMVFSL